MDPTIGTETRKLFSERDLEHLVDRGYSLRNDSNGKMSGATDTEINGTGTYATSNFGLDLPIDVDMFKLSAGEGQQLRVTVRDVNPDLYVRVFDANGDELRGAALDDDERVTVTLPRTGTYYVGASATYNTQYSPFNSSWDALGSFTTDYQLEISLTGFGLTPPGDPAAVPDALEPNNARSGATTLGTANPRSSLAGSSQELTIHNGDEDWFTFTIQGTATADDRLSIYFAGAAGDLDLQLYNEANSVIRSSTSVGNEEVLFLQGLTTGKYWVRVYPFSGAQNTYHMLYNIRPENVLPAIHVTAADAGGGPHVLVFDPVTGNEKFGFYAYNPAFGGGVRVATGDVNRDGYLDIITAPGPGGSPQIRVFDGRNGSPLSGSIGSFLAYSPDFSGGVYVASADVNNDGFDDIITGAGEGGGPHVRVFSGANGSELFGFMAYAPSFSGGVRVAAGDVNADGQADIFTAAGPGAGPHVRVFDGATRRELAGFYAYSPNFRGGVYLAAGDVNGDGRADIVTGAGPGGGPHVRVFAGATGTPLSGPASSFFAYGSDFSGGVRVATALINSDRRADIITAPGPGGGPHVRRINGANGADLGQSYAFNPAFTGGVFVAGRAANAPLPVDTSDATTSGGQHSGGLDVDSLIASALQGNAGDEATVHSAFSELAVEDILPLIVRNSDVAQRTTGRLTGGTGLRASDNWLEKAESILGDVLLGTPGPLPDDSSQLPRDAVFADIESLM